MAVRYDINRPDGLNVKSREEHGAYVLADQPTSYEIQRKNNFEFIVDLGNLLKAGATGAESTSYIYASNGQHILRMSVVSAPVPHFSQNPIEIRRGNSSIKAAGVPTFSNGTLVVNDFIGADTKAVLMAWQNQSYNVSTQKVGLMRDYKKEATLIEYTPDYQVVRKWNLHGCWISGITESDYNMDSNDKSTISATIEYDYAEIDMTGTV